MFVDETNPNRFCFSKIFRDEKANEAHWETGAFKTWWNTVEELFDGGTERIRTIEYDFPKCQRPGETKAETRIGRLSCFAQPSGVHCWQ